MQLTVNQLLSPSDPWTAQPWQASISQAPPDSFTVVPLANSIACYWGSAPRTDGKYPGTLVKLSVPNVADFTEIQLTVPVWFDEAALAQGQAFEFDLMRSEGGLVYQLCSTWQIRGASNGGGKWLTAAAAGGWQDTGMPGYKLPTDRWVDFMTTFTIDRTDKTSTCTKIQLGGISLPFTPTPDLAKVPALAGLGWPDVTAAQAQVTGQPTGGAFSITFGEWIVKGTV